MHEAHTERLTPESKVVCDLDRDGDDLDRGSSVRLNDTDGDKRVPMADGHGSETSQAAPLALAAHGLTKRFPGVVANDHVDLELHAGEIHALLGENGSGKSTLCKTLTGLCYPDAGEVVVSGRRLKLGSPARAYAAGVFMVHQHLSLVERMSVTENVVLGWSRHQPLRFDRRSVEKDVAAAADQFQMPVDPQAMVWQLSMGERQRVEILKALYRGARTLILDEPTTVLTPQETERLFVSLRRMASSGAAVVFISHKLQEVAAVCDRVTVLRSGRNTGTADLRAGDSNDSVDARALARMMVGRDIELSRRVRQESSEREVSLSVDGLVADNDFGRTVVKDVSLDVRKGEILGVAGVAGNGQREFAEAICGLRVRVSGDVVVDGQSLKSGDVKRAMDAGVAFVPEDRMGVGLASGLSVADNLILKAYCSEELSCGPFLRARRVSARTAQLLERFDVRGRADSLVRQLSGGNAQKVLVAREMSSQPRVLVVAAPTRGLDVAATQSVRDLLSEAAASGAAVVMISEDLDEVLDLADRVAVMCDGRITGIVKGESADVEQIGLLMMGRSSEEDAV